jgi:hypothetical protein
MLRRSFLVIATLVNYLQNTSESINQELIQRLRATTDIYSMPVSNLGIQNNDLSGQPIVWDTLMTTLEDITKQMVGI